jgi:hypothetical protein
VFNVRAMFASDVNVTVFGDFPYESSGRERGRVPFVNVVDTEPFETR